MVVAMHTVFFGCVKTLTIARTRGLLFLFYFSPPPPFFCLFFVVVDCDRPFFGGVDASSCSLLDTTHFSFYLSLPLIFFFVIFLGSFSLLILTIDLETWSGTPAAPIKIDAHICQHPHCCQVDQPFSLHLLMQDKDILCYVLSFLYRSVSASIVFSLQTTSCRK